MAKITENGKNVTLETIISYNVKDDTIMVTSKDPDIQGKPFYITLNKSTTAEKTLRELLVSKGAINLEQIGEGLPKTIKHPETFSNDPYIFEIGVTGKNIVKCDASKDSNVLISGLPGSGKTVITKSFLKHAEKYDNIWEYSIISPYLEEEYANFKQSKNKTNAKTIEELNKKLDLVVEDIKNRMQQIENVFKERYNLYNFDEESKIFKKQILILDTMEKIIPSIFEEQFLNELDKEQIAEARNKLSFIYKNSRMVGYYIVLSTSNPAIMTGETKVLMGTRIAMGRMPEKMSFMALGTNNAVRTPKGLGKGYIRVYGDGEFFQAYEN